MFSSMFVFEWQFFSRQPSFYIIATIFFSLGFFAPSMGMSSLGNVYKNGPFTITFILIFLSLFSMFLVVNFIANMALREYSCNMTEIIVCKPLRASAYKMGRFIGAFSVVLVIFSLVPSGFMIGSSIPWVDPSRIGPTHLSYYWTAYLYFSVPTLLMLSCIVYAVATRFRSMMAVYLSVILFFVLNEMSESLLTVPELKSISVFLDPFAWNTFNQLTAYWTPLQKNTQQLEFNGLLMLNRLSWIGIGLLIFFVFSNATRTLSLQMKSPKKEKTIKAASDNSQSSAGRLYKGIANTHWAHFIACTRLEIKLIILDRPFYILCVLSGVLLTTILIVPEGLFGNAYWPVTKSMVDVIASGLSVLSAIIITYYSAEVIWRERELNIGDIVDRMPVENRIFLFAKLSAVWCVLLILIVISMSLTISYQLSAGYEYIDIRQYAISLLYFNLIPWMIVTVLAFLIQIVCSNKYMGMFIMVLFVLSGMLLERMALGHNLFRFSKSPALTYSEMNGYDTSLVSQSLYLIYWGSLGVIFAIVAYGLWQRGKCFSIRQRLAMLGYQIGTSGKIISAFCAVIFIAMGGAIYHNSFTLNHAYNQRKLQTIHADYEKNYAQYAANPIPSFTKLNAKVDIYPQQRKVIIDADIEVQNETTEVIKRFLIAMPGYNPLFSTSIGFNPLEFSVQIEGGLMGPIDGELNTHWFEFERPMMPGDIRKGRFRTSIERPGFSETHRKILLLDKGTFFQNNETFPIFGYMASAELQSPEQRSRFHLPQLEPQHLLEDSTYYNQSYGEGLLGYNSAFIEFETTVSTDIDQIAIAPGYLLDDWTQGNRHYFHYKMDAPIQNYFAYFSGPYQTLSRTVNGVQLSVYYHPGHGMNVERIQTAMKDAIAYYSDAFGPYQHRQMKVIEFPGPKDFGQNFPDTIAFSEQAGFLHNLSDPSANDQVYWFIAHEISHEWWVDGANVQGASMLVETLAQYSAFMLVKNKYGDGALRRMLAFEMDRYFVGRAQETRKERPLSRVGDQAYIYYNKGAIVMMNLVDLLGESRFNLALARFLSKHKFDQSPYPTSIDLLREINQDTSQEEKILISRLLTQINSYDLDLVSVEIKERNDKRFEIDLTIYASRFSADGYGVETEEDLSEAIDIALFSDNPDQLHNRNDAVYIKKHRLKSGKNIVKLLVETKPKFAAIDPYVHLIDKNLANNILEI